MYYIEPDPIQIVECYADYPYAFDGGSKCCKTDLEDSCDGCSENNLEFCNGRKLTLESICCKDAASKSCRKDLCVDYGKLILPTIIP